MFSGYSERWLVALGLIYVVVIIFAPRGAYELIRKMLTRLLATS